MALRDNQLIEPANSRPGELSIFGNSNLLAMPPYFQVVSDGRQAGSKSHRRPAPRIEHRRREWEATVEPQASFVPVAVESPDLAGLVLMLVNLRVTGGASGSRSDQFQTPLAGRPTECHAGKRCPFS